MEERRLSSDCSNTLGTLSWARTRLIVEPTSGLPPEIAAALEFSANAHAGQKREGIKGGNSIPYFTHPVEVARLCAELWMEAGVTNPPAKVLVCAALLHDTLEDCAVSAAELETRFGKEVCRLVLALTKPRLRKKESASARLQRFTRQISAGGLPAVFLKCCDLMHNLAELENTPVDVLRRTVEKGRSYYLPLLESVAIGAEFGKRVVEAIARAEDALGSRCAEVSVGTAGTRLQRVLAKARARKTEVHDAAHLLREILGFGEVVVVQFPRHGSAVVIAGSLNVPLDAGRLDMIRQTAIEHGGFTTVKPKLFRTGPSAAPKEVVYSACLEHGFDGSDTLIVCAMPTSWKDPTSPLPAEVIMRLILAVVTQPSVELFRDLAEEALGLGLELDLAFALEIGVQRGQLSQLVEWRQKCELACQLVEGEVRAFLHTESQRGPLWHRIRVEHRVKSCASILRKFASGTRSRWPDFVSLEDIAGVRVVCPTAWHVERLAHFVTETSNVRILAGPLRRYDLKPTLDGYRGIHAIRLVAVPGVLTAVPCEIQLRTVLQDAWATLSHTVAYKEGRVAEQTHSSALRNLGIRLAECELAITGIFGQLDM